MPSWVITALITLVIFAAWLLCTTRILTEDQAVAMCFILIGVPFFAKMLLD